MLTNLYNKIKSHAGVAYAAALALLFFLFRLEQDRANRDEVKSESDDVSKKDAVLKEKESEDVKAIEAIQKQAVIDKSQPVTIDELNKDLQ